MPVIARFYGLIIKMFLVGSEHNPPHIHVVYNEYNAAYDIRTQQLIGRGLAYTSGFYG